MPSETYSWRSAGVVVSLLMLGLAGWPILPDFYAQEIRSYLPSLVCIPASIVFAFTCFHSPVRGDRIFGLIGWAIGGTLFVAFVFRALHHIGLMPAKV
jgi:hypothetical protein